MRELLESRRSDLLTIMEAIIITEHLQNILQLFDLSPENCVGQGFDGDPVVAGKDDDIQALAKNLDMNLQTIFITLHIV